MVWELLCRGDDPDGHIPSRTSYRRVKRLWCQQWWRGRGSVEVFCSLFPGWFSFCDFTSNKHLEEAKLFYNSHVLPVCISLVLAFNASMSLRKPVNFINLADIFFLLSLAPFATGFVLELMCFIICVEVVLCWTNRVLHRLVLDAVKWGRKSYCLSWRVCCLSKSQENANTTQFRL